MTETNNGGKPDIPAGLLAVRSSIVGSYYRTSLEKDVLYRAKPYTNIRLVRDPDNKYDSNAVKVMIRAYHVGYLSRDDAATYSPLLAQNGGEASGILLNTVDKYPPIEFYLPAHLLSGEDE